MEHGHVRAQTLLGDYYRTGKVNTIPKDEEQAVYWYRKAVEQGDGRGEFSLAKCCYDGLLGVERNSAEAVRLLRLALEHGESRNVKAFLKTKAAQGEHEAQMLLDELDVDD